MHEYDENDVPNGAFSWTSCVTAVKDQGQCGSCWAFSATEASESSYCINQNGTLYTMSEQQLVDCSSSYGNNGCGGGWYFYAWNYLRTHGQEQEHNYPYTARDGTCKYNSANGVVHNSSPTYDTKVSGNQDAMMSAINK